MDEHLHPSFDGVFNVRTSNALANVQYIPDVDSTRGKRKVQQQHSGWSVLTGTAVREIGKVPMFGDVDVMSSNAPMMLCL